MSSYKKQAEQDAELLWKLSPKGIIQREVICEVFKVRRSSLSGWLRRFEKHGIEIPEVTPPNRGSHPKRKVQKGIDMSAMDREPIHNPHAIKVMDETVRPWGEGYWNDDGVWIGQVIGEIR